MRGVFSRDARQIKELHKSAENIEPNDNGIICPDIQLPDLQEQCISSCQMRFQEMCQLLRVYLSFILLILPCIIYLRTVGHFLIIRTQVLLT